MRGYDIVKLFFYEAVVISAIGSFFGTVGGGALSFAFSKIGIDIAKLTGGSMNDLQISDYVYTYFGADMLLISFILGVAIASICAFFPARRAAKFQPVEAMRGVA
jgi:ABC-type antimicrobial peptide transport system permease subunit